MLNVLKNMVDILKMFPDKVMDIWIFRECLKGHVEGPLTEMSSTKGTAISGISSCRKKVKFPC